MPYQQYSCMHVLKTECTDGQTFFISNRYKGSTARSFVIVLIFVKPMNQGWKVIKNIVRLFQILKFSYSEKTAKIWAIFHFFLYITYLKVTWFQKDFLVVSILP